MKNECYYCSSTKKKIKKKKKLRSALGLTKRISAQKQEKLLNVWLTTVACLRCYDIDKGWMVSPKHFLAYIQKKRPFHCSSYPLSWWKYVMYGNCLKTPVSYKTPDMLFRRLDSTLYSTPTGQPIKRIVSQINLTVSWSVNRTEHLYDVRGINWSS